jgi:small conductance mechanosensitive channel
LFRHAILILPPALDFFDGRQTVPIDFAEAWKNGRRIIDSTIALLPNIVLATIILIVFLVIASVVRSGVRRFLQRRQRRQSLVLLLGHLAYLSISIFGFLVAFSVVAPSFHAADLIKLLGIGSVAIGFAFQNILQNFLAGILLLLQEPFALGDWISITGLEGKVEDIQTRATVIRTADGHRVVIPNAVVFTNPVIVGQPPPKKEEALSHAPVPERSGRAA